MGTRCGAVFTQHKLSRQAHQLKCTWCPFWRLLHTVCMYAHQRTVCVFLSFWAGTEVKPTSSPHLLGTQVQNTLALAGHEYLEEASGSSKGVKTILLASRARAASKLRSPSTSRRQEEVGSDDYYSCFAGACGV